MSRKRTGLLDPTPLDCAECRDLMDVAVGLTLTGVPLEQGLPGFGRHIAICANCREEYELLLYTLRAAPGVALPLVSSLPLQRPSPASASVEVSSSRAWLVPSQVLAQQWFGQAGLTLARGDTDLLDRRLLFANAASTPWGLAGLEILAQRVSYSSDHIEIAVQVAFEQPPNVPIRATLEWGDQTLTSELDQHGSAHFTDIVMSSLFDTSTRQAKDDLRLSLSVAS